jgi:hypothetical protein
VLLLIVRDIALSCFQASNPRPARRYTW